MSSYNKIEYQFETKNILPFSENNDMPYVPFIIITALTMIVGTYMWCKQKWYSPLLEQKESLASNELALEKLLFERQEIKRLHHSQNSYLHSVETRLQNLSESSIHAILEVQINEIIKTQLAQIRVCTNKFWRQIPYTALEPSNHRLLKDEEIDQIVALVNKLGMKEFCDTIWEPMGFPPLEPKLDCLPLFPESKDTFNQLPHIERLVKEKENQVQSSKRTQQILTQVWDSKRPDFHRQLYKKAGMPLLMKIREVESGTPISEQIAILYHGGRFDTY